MPFYGPSGGGSTNALLDGSNHTDTVAQTVSRGSIVYGDSTPNWNELTIGGAGKVLASDGTDVSWTSGWTLLSSATISNDATVDFTLTGWTNSLYFAYVFVHSAIVFANDNNRLNVLTSTDGGSSYDTGSTDYGWNLVRVSDTDGLAGVSDASAGQLYIARAASNGSNAAYAGSTWLYNPSGTGYTMITTNGCVMNTDTEPQNHYGGGMRLSAADVDAVRFLANSGNLSSGTIKLYGIAA